MNIHDGTVCVCVFFSKSKCLRFPWIAWIMRKFMITVFERRKIQALEPKAIILFCFVLWKAHIKTHTHTEREREENALACRRADKLQLVQFRSVYFIPGLEMTLWTWVFFSLFFRSFSIYHPPPPTTPTSSFSLSLSLSLTCTVQSTSHPQYSTCMNVLMAVDKCVFTALTGVCVCLNALIHHSSKAVVL